MTGERMISFHLKGPMNNRLPNVGKYQAGETCLLRIGAIACLFPDQRQIRMTDGWTIDVFEGDWAGVERAFRSAYLGNPVRAMERPE